MSMRWDAGLGDYVADAPAAAPKQPFFGALQNVDHWDGSTMYQTTPQGHAVRIQQAEDVNNPNYHWDAGMTTPTEYQIGRKDGQYGGVEIPGKNLSAWERYDTAGKFLGHEIDDTSWRSAITPLSIMMTPFMPGITSALNKGVGSLIPGMTPGISKAVTQGLMSGGLSALGGGDFLKGALTGGLGAFATPHINQAVGSATQGMGSTVQGMAGGAANAALRAALGGGDIGQAVLGGALSGGTAGAAKQFLPDDPMTQGIARMGMQLLPTLLRGGKISPVQLASMAPQLLGTMTRGA